MPYSPPPSQHLPRFATPYMNNTSPPPSQHTMRSSPFNTSPTSLFSPHIPAPCRQLHPPKVPLYRPAVLRSIERPIRLTRDPLTPPTSSAASLNEVYIGDVEYKTGVDFRNFGYGNCGYSNVADLGEIEDDDVPVTEEPDRGHWKVFIIFSSVFVFSKPPPLPILVSAPIIWSTEIRTVALCMDLKRGGNVYPRGCGLGLGGGLYVASILVEWSHCCFITLLTPQLTCLFLSFAIADLIRVL